MWYNKHGRKICMNLIKLFFIFPVLVIIFFASCGSNNTGNNATTLSIGDLHQGGKVAYILQTGDPGYDPNTQHGFIAALEDQTNATWGCFGEAMWTSTALGTGLANTTAIMAACFTIGIAASLCDEHTNADTGTGVYSDWYLPSKDELTQLYSNRLELGGFAEAGSYWSSSEEQDYETHRAWEQAFYNDSKYIKYKYLYGNVRCVRSF